MAKRFISGEQKTLNLGRVGGDIEGANACGNSVAQKSPDRVWVHHGDGDGSGYWRSWHKCEDCGDKPVAYAGDLCWMFRPSFVCLLDGCETLVKHCGDRCDKCAAVGELITDGRVVSGCAGSVEYSVECTTADFKHNMEVAHAAMAKFAARFAAGRYYNAGDPGVFEPGMIYRCNPGERVEMIQGRHGARPVAMVIDPIKEAAGWDRFSGVSLRTMFESMIRTGKLSKDYVRELRRRTGPEVLRARLRNLEAATTKRASDIAELGERLRLRLWADANLVQVGNREYERVLNVHRDATPCAVPPRRVPVSAISKWHRVYALPGRVFACRYFWHTIGGRIGFLQWAINRWN